MSKVKGSKAMKATDPLTKVKSGGVTKPAQSNVEKSKELAKKLSKTDKVKKKVKEPTPSDSEEESDSSESESGSESESEHKIKAKSTSNRTKANGVKPADESDESESGSSDESESEAEAPKASTGKTGPFDGNESDDESGDSSTADDDSDGSAEDGSEDEKAGVSAVMGAAVKNGVVEKDDDSEDDSEESDSDAEKSATVVKAADVNGATKKVESDDDADDSDEESGSSDEENESSESEVEEKPKSTKRKAEVEAPAATKKTKVDSVDDAKKTLFVGNLSWNVEEQWLSQEFEEFGTIEGVRLVTERGTGRSKGYGYVDFANAADAAKAHAAKQGADLDGRPMNVDFANTRPSTDDRQQKRRSEFADSISSPSDTLFLGNLSFQAGQESITEHFQPYGTILSVRIPTDFETGNPKGYGYVTFSSVEEAQAALEAGQGSYLDSRPMRLDFSQPRANAGGAGGRGRGGFDRGRGRGGRGGFNDRGGRGGGRGRGGFGDRGGRGGGRGASTNRGGFNDFKGQKMSFD